MTLTGAWRGGRAGLLLDSRGMCHSAVAMPDDGGSNGDSSSVMEALCPTLSKPCLTTVCMADLCAALQLYVVWTGTDSNGNYLTSSCKLNECTCQAHVGD